MLGGGQFGPYFFLAAPRLAETGVALEGWGSGQCTVPL